MNLAAFVDPAAVQGFFAVLAALLAKEAVIATGRAVIKKVRGDKDPRNDFIADVVEQIVGRLESSPSPKLPPLKK